MSWLLGSDSGLYVFWELRVPRVLGGFLVGSLLAAAGVLIQGVVRNPLADPGLIGISGGAAVAAAVFLWVSSWLALPSALLPVAAFLGALGALMLVMRLAAGKASRSGTDVTLLVLAGVAINLSCNAMIGLLAYLSSDSVLRQISFWSMGSLGRLNWHWMLVLLMILVLSLWFWSGRLKQLDALLLGDLSASALGVDVKPLRLKAVVWVAVMAAISVSACGMIGFIGLVSPHIARLVSGAAHTRVLPLAVIIGGSLMVVADTLARTLIQPAELPIGIITTLVGVPVFIGLLIRERGKTL